jgi:uncharacterized small protein (DUF1192 family)
MAEDEDLPVRRRRRLEPVVLDSLGVEELHEYVQELHGEIARVEAEVARKQTHRNAADAFFKGR